MENLYTVYTKLIENKTYYFIKHFLTFPEFKGVEPVLENFGMHTDFDKACHIAGISDIVIKEQLLNQSKGIQEGAKVIDLNTVNFSSKSASK